MKLCLLFVAFLLFFSKKKKKEVLCSAKSLSFVILKVFVLYDTNLTNECLRLCLISKYNSLKLVLIKYNRMPRVIKMDY